MDPFLAIYCISISLPHAVCRVSCNEDSVCLGPLVAIGIVKICVVVMSGADGQNEAELAESYHPHVTAYLGWISAAEYSALLLVEIAASVFGPELRFATAVFRRSNDIAYSELTCNAVANFHAFASHLLIRHLPFDNCCSGPIARCSLVCSHNGRDSRVTTNIISRIYAGKELGDSRIP